MVGGGNSAIWQPVTETLSQHYRVHLVNLPGFGEQPEIDDYSLATIANVILEKLPQHAIWCGWSLGGLIATYIACHFPKRVDKLIQVCTSLKFVEDGQWLGVEKEVFDAFKIGVSKQPQKTLNRFLSLQAMGSETIKNDIVITNRLLINQPLPMQSALIGGLNLLSEVDLREKFKKLTVPCLSLFGEHDTLVPVVNVK